MVRGLLHSGERPFKYETCGKNFLHRISLKAHEQISQRNTNAEIRFHKRCYVTLLKSHFGMGFLLSVCRLFFRTFYLEQCLQVYFWLIQEFLKNQKESLFNNVFHRFSCLFSLGKFFFIVYQPHLMQTRVLFDLLKIANFCVEYQWLWFNSYELRIV